MIRPILTEKSLRLMEEGQYTFDLNREWTKPQIKFFVEDLFNVNVSSIRTYRLPRQLKTQKIKYIIAYSLFLLVNLIL